MRAARYPLHLDQLLDRICVLDFVAVVFAILDDVVGDISFDPGVLHMAIKIYFA